MEVNLDQATFEANARSIRERFTGPRRDLLLRLNDAGGSMDVFDLLTSRSHPQAVVGLTAFIQLHQDGLIVVDGWRVRLP